MFEGAFQPPRVIWVIGIKQLQSCQAMSIVDCLFAETERFHQGDGDLVDQLMDRIRGLRGEVTWELLRAKHLNRWLKANAKARHFGEAVSNLIANDEGGLVKTKPLTWRR